MATSSLKLKPSVSILVPPHDRHDFLDSIRPVVCILNVLGLSHYQIEKKRSKFNRITPSASEANLTSRRLKANKFLRVFNAFSIIVQWTLVIIGFRSSEQKLNNLPVIMEGIQTLGNMIVVFVTTIFFWRDGHLLIEVINGLARIESRRGQLTPENYRYLHKKTSVFVMIQVLLVFLSSASGVFMFKYVSNDFKLGWFRIFVYLSGLIMTNALLLTTFAFLEQFKAWYARLLSSLQLEEALRHKMAAAADGDADDKQKQKHVSNSAFYDALDSYNELWTLARKFNEFANIHILLQFCVAYMYALTAGFFLVYMKLLTTYYFFFTVGTWMVYIGLMTGMPIVLFHSTYTAAEKVRTMLSAKHKDLFIQQQLVFQDNTFHVFHFFSINLNFLLIMVGSLTTNLLILWQFQRMMSKA